MIFKNLNAQLKPELIRQLAIEDEYYQDKYGEDISVCGFQTKEKTNCLLKIKPFVSKGGALLYTAETYDGEISRSFGAFFKSREALYNYAESFNGKSMKEIEKISDNLIEQEDRSL